MGDSQVSKNACRRKIGIVGYGSVGENKFVCLLSLSSCQFTVSSFKICLLRLSVCSSPGRERGDG